MVLKNTKLLNLLIKDYENKINNTEKRVNTLTNEANDLKENIIDNSDRIDKLKKEIQDLEEEMVSNNNLLKIAERKLIKRKEKLKKF